MIGSSFVTAIFVGMALATPNHARRADNGENGVDVCAPYYSDQDILDAIAGTYSLINTTSALNGETIKDEAYGEHPVGIITYSKSGWMSATITATEPAVRPNLTFPFTPQQADSDWALVGKHSLGYAGPVSVNREFPATPIHGQLFHGPLTVANVPSWANTQQKRNYTVYKTPEGKLLQIKSIRGGGYTGELWWRKVD